MRRGLEPLDRDCYTPEWRARAALDGAGGEPACPDGNRRGWEPGPPGVAGAPGHRSSS